MIKTYLGERNVRCRNWPDCDFLGIPAVETEYGFYCYQCASTHSNENIQVCAEKSKTYRQNKNKQNLQLTQKETTFDKRQRNIENKLRKFLGYLKKNPQATKKEASAALQISIRTIDNYINRLKAIGIQVNFLSVKQAKYKINDEHSKPWKDWYSEDLSDCFALIQNRRKRKPRNKIPKLNQTSC